VAGDSDDDAGWRRPRHRFGQPETVRDVTGIVM